jgi:hypothetical protein
MPPPAPFYWEEPPEVAAQHPWWDKALQNARFYGGKLVEGGEAVGEVVAGFLGLTDSKFQYVVDAIEHEVRQCCSHMIVKLIVSTYK